MKKMPGIILVLVALLLGAPAMGAEFNPYFNSYFNDRFAYKIDIPSFFDFAEESENGDGMTFSHESGEYTLWVWGAHNIFMDDGDSILEELTGTVKIVRGTASSGTDFYTVEFFDEDDSDFINHEYGLVTPDTIITYRLRFPEAEQGIMGGVTSRMDQSLAPWDGSVPSPDEGFWMEDGKILLNGIELEKAQFTPVESEFFSGWVELSPLVSDMIDEELTGVFFFSPEGGDKFIFEDGSGSRADIFLKIHDASNMEKMAEYSGLRGSWTWIDPHRCVFTRIDGTRDKGFGYGFGYGLRLSVVMYDTAMREASVLMEATDTASYFFERMDGDELVITEERVEKAADWDDDAKRREKEIRIDIPAAG
ncbi:MAG: hypothetical protein GX843_09170 [Synergistaceae bacterium]|nr:hypothetical protein [Synergistaceae bacterium]